MGKTAFKTNIDEPQYALGNYGYFSGRHYFEINLLTFYFNFNDIIYFISTP